MQIKIDLKILIFVLIFLLTNQLKIYILLMIFACIHELGHLIIGIILKFKLDVLEIKPIGFSVSFINPIKDYNRKILKSNILELKKIIIYLCGPIVNVVLVIIITYLNITETLKLELIYINLILAIVNLIPIYPLDGGRILKSTICIFKGLKKSYIYTEKISSISMIIILFVSSLLILYIQNVGVLFIILYLTYIKMNESKRVRQKLRLYDMLE